MKPVRFLAACVALAPVVVAVSTAVTVVWYERVWLPRIAGS